MPRRKSWSLHWLTLAVLLPLGLLVVLAFQGMRAQADAAWAAKEDEAGRVAKIAAENLAQELARSVKRFKRFPDPPLPGTPSQMDAVLDGTDLPALTTLSKSTDAGLSPAGLPRRVLAAFRLLELNRERLFSDPEELARIRRLVTEECPSILTERAFYWMEAEQTPEMERWLQSREVIRLLEQHPVGGWIRDEDSYWWIEPSKDEVAFVFYRPDDSHPRLQTWMPPGFHAFVSTDTSPPRSFAGIRPFAVAPVAFGNGLRVEVNITDYDGLSKKILDQQRWTVWLLTIAGILSLLGLFFIHRTLRRERQLNEMKSQFVASVSHELRAPVASIRLMADALEADKVAPETAKEFHRLIAREGARLSTLVGNVLDHARIEQGKRLWKMEPCDLESLVADTLRVMEPLAREKNITLRSALSPLEAPVDAGAIQQALVNLLDNAIKFSPAGSTVETSLSIDEEHRTWRISVRDEGPGIAIAEQAKIFERFYRPGDELRRETQGTGIGLSLVKAIAEAHGGSVSVESEPGQGSAFKVAGPPGSAGLQTGTPGPPIFKPEVGNHADPPDENRCREPSSRSQTGAPGEHLSLEP